MLLRFFLPRGLRPACPLPFVLGGLFVNPLLFLVIKLHNYLIERCLVE
jgi:hypothetical protein